MSRPPHAALVLATGLLAATGAAAAPGAAATHMPDSLGTQTVAMSAADHAALVRAIGARGGRADSLQGVAISVVLFALRDVEASCRSGLFPKDMEPGSPWLAWRNLGRVASDSCAWYAGAVSCADTVCGGGMLAHDRLALVCVGPSASRITLVPRRPASIGDDGSVRVDSVTVIGGGDHALIQARRVTTSQHPCYDGPEYRSAEDSEIVVVRGGRVLQALAIPVSSESSSHDDVDGDSGTNVTGSLSVSATSIVLRQRVEDWIESPDGDPKKTRRSVRTAGLGMVYNGGVGRFVRAR